MNYELDTYLDALKDFPDFETKLHTEKGDAICQKQDIFKGLMWFAYTDNFANWHVLKIEQVKEIMAQNKEKKRVSALEDFAIEIVIEPEANFNNAMGQESLTRFDQPKKSNKSKNKNKNKVANPNQVQGQNPNQGQKINPNQGQNTNPNQIKKPNPNQTRGGAEQSGANPNQQNKKPVIIKKNENKE